MLNTREETPAPEDEAADVLGELELAVQGGQAKARPSLRPLDPDSASPTGERNDHVERMKDTVAPNPRKLSRREMTAKRSVITPVSIQRELLKYQNSNLYNIPFWEELQKLVSIDYFKVFVLWTTWMSAGTVYYALKNDLGWKKGFFMMVNVGYSIGWGYPREMAENSLWYSIFNVLVGAAALNYCLRVFAITILSDSKSWYAVAVYERTMSDSNVSMWRKTKEFVKNHKKKVINISIFIFWVMGGVVWALVVFREWKVVQGLYFAVSSLSTGGMYPIPENAADDSYVIVGVFSALGVPLMGLAMSDLTRMLLKFGDPEKAKEQIQAKVTKEELKMLTKFGMDDGSGVFTRTEFIILSLMRLRVLTPVAIEEMNKRFNTLDIGSTGYLSVDDILHQTRSRSITHVFSKNNVNHSDRRARLNSGNDFG